MKTPYDVILSPVMSEKAYSGFSSEEAKKGEAPTRYTFWVHPDANKTEIANAVEQAFKVKVVSVNTQNTLGKNKRLGLYSGKRIDRKKAIVTVAYGQKIEALEGLV
ncbi:MAG: 50S ribosomal protein L23 [Meiothermus sp.]|nr:50S ribosomal protein L23 [Meiothermus sp.]